MTHDEIIRMAREAGADDLCIRYSNVFLTTFAALVSEAKDKEIASLNQRLFEMQNAAIELAQPQGEPVAFEQCEELSADKARWYRMADMIEQQAQELKGVLRQALNLIEGEWPEGDEVAQPVVDKIKKIVGERHDI